VKREYTNAKVGIERTTKRKKPLDHLTRDVLAAQAAGMSYGKWKATHPHTGGEEESEPEELIVDPSKRALVCMRSGKTFLATPKQSNMKYCGDDCRYQAQLARQRELHPERFKPRYCKVCGKELARENKGLFCSSTCKVKDWRARDKERHPEKYQPRPCPICGKMWVPSNGRRYCSQECSMTAGRAHARENEQRRREREKEAKANEST
jgi:predicted nucleic acid-binding Zn ribbon protein